MSNLTESEKARNEGISRVTKSNASFIEEAYDFLLALPNGEYTGEDIRIIASSHGINPNHNNAWGALICKATRNQILIWTGKMAKSTIKSSHAKKNFVYSKLTKES